VGYVKQHLAKENEQVYGLIIARSIDDKLHYAVSTQSNIAVHAYVIDFKLCPSVKNNQEFPFKLLTLGDLAKA
jgi:hypothetical protein